MKKTIFITGASSGFGKAIAQQFAAAGWHCIIAGRRTEKLIELATTLENQYPIKTLPLTLDVRDKKKVFETIENLPPEWQKIDVLVNNAGLALGRENFVTAAMDDWDTMIQTNLAGLLYVCRAVLPYMLQQEKGHIINIGSIAAKTPYLYGNVYCATKAAVDTLSRAMRIDLLPHNIKVSAIHPGAAETEFSLVRFKGNETQAKATYEGFTPLSAEDIAGIVFYVASLPAHVCINDLIVTPTQQADGNHLWKK